MTPPPQLIPHCFNPLGKTEERYGGYTPLEWIEGTGTQNILTNIVLPMSGTCCELTCAVSQLTHESIDGGGGTNYDLLLGQNYNIQFGIGLASSYSSSNTVLHFTTGAVTSKEIYGNYNEKYTIVWNKNGKGEFFINNKDTKIARSGNLYIKFFNAWGPNGSYKIGRGRLYRCKITKNGQLVYNFVPVLDKNNEPCLLETVSQTPYYNTGTGRFLYKRKHYYAPVGYSLSNTPCDLSTLGYNSFKSQLVQNIGGDMLFDIYTDGESQGYLFNCDEMYYDGKRFSFAMFNDTNKSCEIRYGSYKNFGLNSKPNLGRNTYMFHYENNNQTITAQNYIKKSTLTMSENTCNVHIGSNTPKNIFVYSCVWYEHSSHDVYVYLPVKNNSTGEIVLAESANGEARLKLLEKVLKW